MLSQYNKQFLWKLFHPVSISWKKKKEIAQLQYYTNHYFKLIYLVLKYYFATLNLIFAMKINMKATQVSKDYIYDESKFAFLLLCVKGRN